jgi:hypothetical protein
VTPKRSGALLTALALLVLLGLGHLIVPFVPDAEKIPAIVRYGDVALGALSLIAGFGLWRLQQWGMILTIIIAALNIVSAAPGVIAAPNLGLQVVTAVYVALSLVIIVLMIAPSTRKASASGALGTQK